MTEDTIGYGLFVIKTLPVCRFLHFTVNLLTFDSCYMKLPFNNQNIEHYFEARLVLKLGCCYFYSKAPQLR